MDKDIINIIIGKNSNLSMHLKSKIKNVLLIPTLDIKNSLNKIDFNDYKIINIIFNQFQLSSKLNNLENPFEYINRAITSTAEVLEYIKTNELIINKIIYTSSSSVYGNNPSCNENDITTPLNLHASLKLANEQLIVKFCLDNSIDYSITRLFNMYGGDDNFSIISKIIKTYKSDDTLTVINSGEAIRDYIHISDIVYSYEKILLKKNIPIINIGASNGKSLLHIFDYLKQNGIKIKTSNIKRDELKVSISRNDLLLSIIGDYQFQNLEYYLLNKLVNGV